MVRYAVIALLVILIGYGLFRAWPLLSGPAIVVDIPTNYTTSTGFITLSGHAVNTTDLRVDGGPLLIDEHGNFSERIDLPSGTSILSLTALDRFGRSTTITRTVSIQ